MVLPPLVSLQILPKQPHGPRAPQPQRQSCLLATLLQACKAKHVPTTAPDPMEAIKFRMNQSGLSIKDFESIASTKS